MKSFLSIISCVLIIFGILLLTVSFLGSWTVKGKYENIAPRSWERFDRSLAESTLDIKSLYSSAKKRFSGKLEQSSPRKIMRQLFETTIDRFTHGTTPAQHTLFSNWILYGMGLLNPAFSYIYNPDIFMSHGSSVWCGQSSYALMHLAQMAGIRARHVGLNGHVVMEAWYDNDWHMYDPDLEVIPIDESEGVFSVYKLAKNKSLIRQLYQGRGDIDNIVSIISSREDNSFISYPAGAQFVWSAEMLRYFEIIAQWLKFIVPITFIVIGIIVLFLFKQKSWLSLR